MVNDSSLGGGAPQFVFDIDSQKGVMTLLASVRASELSPEQKNELRDIVFLYTNGGKDQSVRILLQQKVLTYGLQPPASTAYGATSVRPTLPFGTSRPAPAFSFTKPATLTPVTKTVTTSPQPEPVVKSFTPPEPQPAPVPIQTPVPPPPPVSIPQPVTVPPVPEVVSVVQPPPASPSQPAIPMPESAVNGSVASSYSYDPNVAMQRIREIKALVNERVGNPVNLVDINNDVGREYMAALLDAMKKLNSGTSVFSSMKRLEDAFSAVEKTLALHDKGLATTVLNTPLPELVPIVRSPQPEPVVKSFTPPEPQPAPVPIQTSVPPPPPVSIPQPIPVVPVQKSVKIPVSQPQTDDGADDRWVESQNIRPEDIPPPAPIPVKIATTIPSVPIPRTTDERTVKSGWGPATDTLQPTVIDGRVASLAESDKKLRSISELPSADELSTSATGDPLTTKEVDDGLQQLLLEWPIFKKSGLFGTGPKGYDHPLFKKIAALQIPLLLAGRFEGATQEIKQSITDYMNGWRYEQGIIYEQGETFEHYLRRVIRHILDLQKKRHNS